MVNSLVYIWQTECIQASCQFGVIFLLYKTYTVTSRRGAVKNSA